MKWCFIVNSAAFMMEFFGKVAHQAVAEGDECVAAINSKFAESERMQFFPTETKSISKTDWCMKHYDPKKKEFGDFSWCEFSGAFERYSKMSFGYKESVDILSQLYQFTDFVLTNEKPDVVISELPADVHNEMFKYLCDKRGIPYIGITDSLFDTLALYDKGWTDSRFLNSFKSISLKDISTQERSHLAEWLHLYISHTRIPKYVHSLNFRFSPLSFLLHYMARFKHMATVLFKYVLKRGRLIAYDYESEIILRYSIWAPFETLKRQLRIMRQKRFYRSAQKEDRFFLYPLQFQPEASTLVMARHYTDQIHTIQRVAFSLPFPYKLYVKEHPYALGTKPDKFYRALARIPNVVLIKAGESVKDLVQNCQGVISLTSTIGLEAALAGKPSYIFGNAFFSYHPLCTKLSNFDELREQIQSDLEHPSGLSNLEEINMRFLASYLRNTIPGDTGLASMPPDTNDYKGICQSIRERVTQLS